jgi:hypothetical protein
MAMQIATLDRKVVSSGIGSQNKMGMVLDGTAFRILSDGLYSDKIGSLVRETYSNAIDSHIMAGQPNKPGWLQIPNSMDPTYIVRDEGIGLDEEGVMTTATTYFGSTKRADNTAIGGFGLGFKSPFAYCDQWTIVAIKDGVSRMFSAYMNDEGEPNVALLASTPTDKPNGVEIRVPVKQQDLGRFRQAVVDQLQFFTPRPIMANATGMEWPDPRITLQGDNYALLTVTGGRYNFDAKWVALIGPVAFPVDKAQFRNELTPRAQSLFDGAQGRLTFEVGEISPAPSRENLQYNPKTVRAIATRLDQVAAKFALKIEQDVSGSSNYFEACGHFTRLKESLNSRLHGAVDSAKFKGTDLKTSFYLEGSNFPGVTYYQFSPQDLDKERFTLREERQNANLTPNDHTIFLIDDLPSTNNRQASRIKLWYDELGYRVDRVIMLRPRGDTQEVPQKIVDSLNGFPADRVLKLSDLPPPEIVRTLATVGQKAKTLPGVRLVRRDNIPQKIAGKSEVDYCSHATTGVITPGFYVITEHNVPLGTGDCEQMLRQANFMPGDIHFVPKSIADRVIGEPGWVDFFAAFAAKVEAEKAEVTEALKRWAEHEALDGDAFTYPVSRFLITLNQNSVEAPARTRSSFWKVYRWFRETTRAPLTDRELSLVLSAEAVGADWAATVKTEALEKFGASTQALVAAFKKDNPTLFEVVDDRRISLSAKSAAELATKLA